MTKHEIAQLPTASLAYLGDSVLEILVRRRLVLDGKGDIHARALSYVTAVRQSEAFDRISAMLTEDELDILLHQHQQLFQRRAVVFVAMIVVMVMVVFQIGHMHDVTSQGIRPWPAADLRSNPVRSQDPRTCAGKNL